MHIFPFHPQPPRRPYEYGRAARSVRACVWMLKGENFAVYSHISLLTPLTVFCRKINHKFALYQYFLDAPFERIRKKAYIALQFFWSSWKFWLTLNNNTSLRTEFEYKIHLRCSTVSKNDDVSKKRLKIHASITRNANLYCRHTFVHFCL